MRATAPDNTAISTPMTCATAHMQCSTYKNWSVAAEGPRQYFPFLFPTACRSPVAGACTYLTYPHRKRGPGPAQFSGFKTWDVFLPVTYLAVFFFCLCILFPPHPLPPRDSSSLSKLRPSREVAAISRYNPTCQRLDAEHIEHIERPVILYFLEQSPSIHYLDNV